MRVPETAIRELQKSGKYEPTGTREQTKEKAIALCKAAEDFDRKHGVEWSQYGIARDAFGYYMAVEIA